MECCSLLLFIRKGYDMAMNLVNLLSVENFRVIVPVNAIVDNTVIASAINHAQVSLIPAITSRSYYDMLCDHLVRNVLTPVEQGFLKCVSYALACMAASHLVPMVGNQIHPTQISDAMVVGSKRELQNYYMAQASSYMPMVYGYCEEHGIEYNRYRSKSFCSVVLGGNWC